MLFGIEVVTLSITGNPAKYKLRIKKTKKNFVASFFVI